MKKIILTMLMVATLVACNNNVDIKNPLKCDEGYHIEDEVCVIDEQKATIEVSFDAMLGSDVNTLEITNGSSIDLVVSERDGYDFLGWTLDNSGDAEIIIDPFYPSSDVTLYAKWQLREITMSFITNGGSTVNQIIQDYNSSISQPDDPIKDGFVFGGWFYDSELVSSYVFTTMPSENITLYAKWDVIDWSDIELYLEGFIPNELSESMNFPTTYQDYLITWESSNPEIISNDGIYFRPYQLTTITLSAILQYRGQTMTKTYNIDVAGYKSLSAPLASSYIYRDYNAVTDSFFKNVIWILAFLSICWTFIRLI